MDECLTGGQRRYHIESCVGKHPLADTYRVFTRRKVGRKIKRRYYALITCHQETQGAQSQQFQSELERSIASLPHPVHIDEEFDCQGVHCVVLARGKDDRKASRWKALTNKGYLMVLLAIVIFILMLLHFLATPTNQV